MLHNHYRALLYLLLTMIVQCIAVDTFADAKNDIAIQIHSAVFDHDKLVIELEIANQSQDYLIEIIPEHFLNSQGKGLTWNLPFRTVDKDGTRINLFTDVAHCVGSHQAPRGLTYGVKQLKRGSKRDDIVLLMPIRENFPFHKRGKIHKPLNRWLFDRDEDYYIFLDDLVYLKLESGWINVIDLDKLKAVLSKRSAVVSIDMKKITSVKLTIGIINDPKAGFRLESELEHVFMCGQHMKEHMIYVTAEKEITRVN